jgi:hypothetical protein
LHVFVPLAVQLQVAFAENEPLKVKFEPLTVMLPPELNVALGLKRKPEAFVPVVKLTIPKQPVVWHEENVSD